MKLKAYLDKPRKKRLTMSAFAEIIDRDVSTVSRICAGQIRPDWATMDRVFIATGGKVTPNDFQASK